MIAPDGSDAGRSAMAAERMLHDAAMRMARQPAGRVAIVLHLSLLAPPAPRPHHRRIARACMQDTAALHEGKVFVLRSGDLVLLCRAGAGASPSGRTNSADPASLPDVLRRLLRVDTPAPVDLVSVWPAETRLSDLVAYATAALAASEPVGPVEEEAAGQPGTVDAIGAVLGTSDISDIVQRQTGIVLGPASARGEGGVLRPIYREVTFSIGALEARIASHGRINEDPFLFRHLAAKLDQRMLEVLLAGLGLGGPLDVAGQSGPEPGVMLHVNLTVPGILSEGFRRFAAAAARLAREPGQGPIHLGVELSLIEATADPAAFARARGRIAQAGFALLLDGVSHLALSLCRPMELRPDMVKLDWSPRLQDLPAGEAAMVDQAISEFGASRMVLQRAETEAALRWGMARGIRRFQGRHVDAMLGAARIVACPQAQACTLRQCIERSGATGVAGRAGCHNLRLLDAGAPPEINEMTRPPRTARSEPRRAARAAEMLS